MGSVPEPLQEMLRMLTVSFERHLEGVELDERLSGDGVPSGALWSYMGTYVSPHDGSESERVEFGWRRSCSILHLLVWGIRHVSSEG